ncbi:MAG TPA: glucose 1-dehydrogenase [Pseudomonas sp.]|jgi:glucose 1-dehydrogenase|nr:glucose 1-dehydrogenase [Pseudomonas sp.]
MAQVNRKVFPVLEGKVAIVTGAAMGMGEATARLFAEAGAKVVLADFNEALGAQVAESIVANGGEAAFIKVDISQSEQVQRMVAFAVERFGRLDAAVNNAALKPDNAPVAEFDEAYWDRLMSVDLKGTALCMKYELAQMVAQGDGGSIINISSVSGFRPQPNTIAYVTAKHGVNGLTKNAAMEYGRHNIRVNAVSPGAIDTPMLKTSLEEAGLDRHEFAKKLSVLERFGQPDEVAQGSLWLASDASSFVTGTVLQVDGGYTGAM